MLTYGRGRVRDGCRKVENGGNEGGTVSEPAGWPGVASVPGRIARATTQQSATGEHDRQLSHKAAVRRSAKAQHPAPLPCPKSTALNMERAFDCRARRV